MIRVLSGEEDSGSEVQFHREPHAAPPGNIPPTPVDSHPDVRHRVMGPSGGGTEGTAADAAASTSRSRTSEGWPGYGAIRGTYAIKPGKYALLE